MALASERQAATAAKPASSTAPLSPALEAAGLARPNLADSPCVGIEADQSGIEIEDTEGRIWIFPYSVFLFAVVRREHDHDLLTLTIGGYVITVKGRGLRAAAEGLRRYSVVYLRPLGHDLVKTAPDKQAVIQGIVVYKERNGKMKRVTETPAQNGEDKGSSSKPADDEDQGGGDEIPD